MLVRRNYTPPKPDCTDKAAVVTPTPTPVMYAAGWTGGAVQTPVGSGQNSNGDIFANGLPLGPSISMNANPVTFLPSATNGAGIPADGNSIQATPSAGAGGSGTGSNGNVASSNPATGQEGTNRAAALSQSSSKTPLYIGLGVGFGILLLILIVAILLIKKRGKKKNPAQVEDPVDTPSLPFPSNVSDVTRSEYYGNSN